MCVPASGSVTGLYEVLLLEQNPEILVLHPPIRLIIMLRYAFQGHLLVSAQARHG